MSISLHESARKHQKAQRPTDDGILQAASFLFGLSLLMKRILVGSYDSGSMTSEGSLKSWSCFSIAEISSSSMP
ncbi:MAG: hypothetical protein SPK50_03710 [Mobiluncus porci]|uniref:hypothetical protein n=1 Tax=Mobiluncus TaxID=2050 RepID=UPI001E466035|nr:MULTISPECIES: hypothetical protein [Mobiluncus]MCI6584340.1 hypothetical protein [Mobiluncus sp.]MDD7540661.1 hypothetical protein [Mobiluncus porci]MDY5748224.1 hypothetical protein [Mobiluncus porci]